MSVFKSRKQREAEAAALAAAQEKQKHPIRSKLASVKVSDAIAIAGAAAAGVGTVFTTVGVVKNVCATPAETPEEICASEILQWLLDVPGLKPNSDVWRTVENSDYCKSRLKGASWTKRTLVRKMVTDKWPEMSAAQQKFINEHLLDESKITRNQRGRRNNRGRK